MVHALNPPVFSASSSSSSIGNLENSNTNSSTSSDTSPDAFSTPDASLRVAGELDEEDADMFTYFESKLVQAEEQQGGEGGREVGGKGSNVVETGEEEYDYSSLNLLNLLNLQNDRPTFRNNIMESEFLKSNAKTGVERGESSDSEERKGVGE